MPSLEEVVSRVGKQSNLAISLFCYLIADALFSENRLLTYSILAMLIISGPMAAGKTRARRVVTLVLAVGMIGLGYATTVSESDHLEFIAYMVASLFFMDMIYLISRSVLIEETQVTGETIWAAINIYLLFGMMFAFLYSAVLALNSGAFAGGILENDKQDITQYMVYYSFVTMTTLGYGDITPKVHVAATLAYVQALVGQLYVAILIARLVSMYSTQSEED
jgi:hypothetical protein